ncbi:ABC-F family ATP-binding cassette domain-containing protein [Vibrio proteolyticus]|uniref:Putative ABC transporter ATP-binding protein n=1 Tax=Vibrio proteolyticus NBRC 13287 TaxID=1219065 RepID=U3BNL2_VIBPR|nr:ATP-binding cassette domain-containing protein [Vibrio proteolyticus]GAD68168.1 putative ABC transporter ATP-binding protein [Vibrio proteolyticus NBRC 13287]
MPTQSSLPMIQATHLSYTFDNGHTLLSEINGLLTDKRTGLVGRNGVGKSVLASLLSGELTPTGGSVQCSVTLRTYSQQPSHLLNSELSVAEFLGVWPVLDALQQIENGHCDPELFERVGERWTLRDELAKLMLSLGLPDNVHLPCRALSGGQLSRLQLWQLFQSTAELLILDEPSNHLDETARQWLVAQMREFSGSILLVSHDRILLREMAQIWELGSLGLTQYGGNYDHYVAQKHAEQTALTRQCQRLDKEHKQLARQIQRNQEKAEQRSAQGRQLRRQGGVPKIVLNQRRSDASASASGRIRAGQQRQSELHRKREAVQDKLDPAVKPKIYLPVTQGSAATLVTLRDLILPFGNDTPINLRLTARHRLLLSGDNGSGKSTLLKIISGECFPRSGERHINTSVCYLDQHFSLLTNEFTMLECLMSLCRGLAESQARTLLAGIGFRRGAVFRQVSVLSGGEKMKLAMLVVSHQPGFPLLLLDEPDNHLDLLSRQQLAQALAEYQGAFVVVTHDQEFAQQAGVQQQLTLIRTRD